MNITQPLFTEDWPVPRDDRSRDLQSRERNSVRVGPSRSESGNHLHSEIRVGRDVRHVDCDLAFVRPWRHPSYARDG